MPNFSHACIVGHLGRDAETKAVGERTVINFSVATTRKAKDAEITTWWRVAYWVKSDRVSKHLTKGTPVLVSGEAYVREYDGKDGSKKEVKVLLRIDTPIEVDYYLHGGILPYVLRELVAKAA